MCARVVYGACILSLEVARARARVKPFTVPIAPNPNARVAIYNEHPFETVPEITPVIYDEREHTYTTTHISV